MSHRTNADKLEPLGLSFPLPDDPAWRPDVTKKELELLSLFGLSAVYDRLGCFVQSQVPVPVKKPVTSTVTLLAAASVKPRKLTYYNNGIKDVIILEGAVPGFIGQSGNLPSGNFTVDFGVVLGPGDYYESPVAHTALANGRCRTGETSQLTVTPY